MKTVRNLPPVLLVFIFACHSFVPAESCAKHCTLDIRLLKPKGFRVTLTDARDIRQLHIFWNYRKPYNRTSPYSSTDFTNVSFNENFDRSVSVGDTEIQLQLGDSIFYWLLLITREWERITLHKQNFWVKFNQSSWESAPVPFAETYYRDFNHYPKHWEL